MRQKNVSFGLTPRAPLLGEEKGVEEKKKKRKRGRRNTGKFLYWNHV